MSFFSAVLTLWLVMDPLGNIPLFIAALKTVEPHRRVLVIVREQFIALFVMIAFLFLGRGLMNALHVSNEALTVAGGVILGLIAVRMIFPTSDKNLREDVMGEPFIVPLAVPYTAGPSLLATEMLFVSNEPGRMTFWLLALIVAWFFSAILLVSCGWFQRYLGERFMTAIERLMGMLLAVISTQMFLSGIQLFFAR
ncbi:MAG: MarC family protein [Propionibacteriaceae bacterium]